MRDLTKAWVYALLVIGCFLLSSNLLAQTGILIRSNSLESDETTRAVKFAHGKSNKEPRMQRAPKGGIVAPSLASELSVSLMNPDLKNKMDQRYLEDMKSFMYFQGYGATSRDARGRFYGIDPQEELAVRQEMAHSVRNHMLLRGIPKFLLSRKNTKHLAQAYEAAVESTHIDVTLSNSNSPAHSRPWRLAAGFNPIEISSYARLSNDIYTFEVDHNMSKFSGLEDSDLKNADFHLMKRLNSSYSLGNRYNLFNKNLAPYLGYTISKDLNTQLSTSIPLTQSSVIGYMHTTISFAYLL